MQLLIRREFNKSIILRILLYQDFVVSSALNLLSSCLTASEASRYVVSSIY